MAACSLLFLVAAISQGAPGALPREWVVKEVIPPRETSSGHDVDWRSASLLGDHDRDGLPEFVVQGAEFGHSTAGWFRARVSESLHFDSFAHQSWSFQGPAQGHLSNFIAGPLSALLATPGGRQLAVMNGLEPQSIEFYALPARQLTGAFVGDGGLAFRPAGDIDGDGWDDLYALYSVYLGDLEIRAISGRDYSVIWEVTDNFGYAFQMPVEAGAGMPADLDGDGIGEQLNMNLLKSPQGSVLEWSVTARSGADGSQVWSQNGVPAAIVGAIGGYFLATGLDVTDDGVADCVAVVRNRVLGLDGSDGSQLWERPLADLAPLLPQPGVQIPELWSRPFLSRSPASAGEYDLVLFIRELDPVVPWTSVVAVYQLDASDGTIRGRSELPGDLQPFNGAALAPAGSVPVAMPLGDLDRDGFGEFALRSNWLGRDRGAMAILGPRTLHGPGQVTLVQPAVFDVHLPTAASRPCVLLASSAFDRSGGKRFGTWRTLLQTPDPLLDYATAQLPWIGQLDGDGRLGIQLTLPQQPALVGATLWLRAVVPQAQGTGVYTQSTLASVEVLP